MFILGDGFLLPLKLGWLPVKSPRFIVNCHSLSAPKAFMKMSSIDSCLCVACKHLGPGHFLGWNDSAAWCAWSKRGNLGSELGEYFSYCRSIRELDIWWRCPNPWGSSWAIQLHMRPRPRPCIQPLCSTMWLSMAFYRSKILRPTKREEKSWCWLFVSFVAGPVGIGVPLESNLCGRFRENVVVHCSTHIL